MRTRVAIATKGELIARLRSAIIRERELGIAATPLTEDRLPPRWRLPPETVADPPLMTPAQVEYIIAETRRRWAELVDEVRAVSQASY